MTAIRVPLGSVTTGTMRLEDLIPSFLACLGQLDKAKEMAIFAEYTDVIDADDMDMDQADYCLEALFNALNELAPPYCHFGAHEGDGADYGFWVSWDSLEDACHDGEIDKGDDIPDFPREVPFLHVNDHGNATLYSPTGEEIWSVV